MWYKNVAGRFFGLVTKHACDRRNITANYYCCRWHPRVDQSELCKLTSARAVSPRVVQVSRSLGIDDPDINLIVLLLQQKT